MIDFDGAAVVAIPVTAGYGEPTVRECVLLEGPQGWGEFSPPTHVDAVTATRYLTAAVEPGTVGWPDPVRGRVPVAVRVPEIAPAAARHLVATSGCTTAEVSVGADLDDDVARLAAVREALGPDGRIRIDAHGVWESRRAGTSIRTLQDAIGQLEMVVEPCSQTTELPRSDVPIARREGDADVLVIDVAAAGGVRRSLRMAERRGMPCVVTAGRETSIGLAGAVALAGALPELPYACAVARPPWVEADVVTAGRALVPVDGHVPVAPMPAGPDPELLRRYAVTDPGTLSRWRSLIAAARTTLTP